MLSEDSAVAGRWPEVILERLCGPNVIAVEGDLLTAERRDMGKQIIVDNLTLGTQLDHSVLMVLISLAESLAGRPPYRPAGGYFGNRDVGSVLLQIDGLIFGWPGLPCTAPSSTLRPDPPVSCGLGSGVSRHGWRSGRD